MISERNTLLQFVIPKELKLKLQAEAQQQNRSMANLIVTILEENLQSDSNSLKKDSFSECH